MDSITIEQNLKHAVVAGNTKDAVRLLQQIVECSGEVEFQVERKIEMQNVDIHMNYGYDMPTPSMNQTDFNTLARNPQYQNQVHNLTNLHTTPSLLYTSYQPSPQYLNPLPVNRSIQNPAYSTPNLASAHLYQPAPNNPPISYYPNQPAPNNPHISSYPNPEPSPARFYQPAPNPPSISSYPNQSVPHLYQTAQSDYSRFNPPPTCLPQSIISPPTNSATFHSHPGYYTDRNPPNSTIPLITSTSLTPSSESMHPSGTKVHKMKLFPNYNK